MPEELKQHIKEKQSLRPNEVNLPWALIKLITICNFLLFYLIYRLALFGCHARVKIQLMLKTLRHVIIILAWVSPISTSLSKTLRDIYRQLLLFSSPLKVSSFWLIGLLWESNSFWAYLNIWTLTYFHHLDMHFVEISNCPSQNPFAWNDEISFHFSS